MNAWIALTVVGIVAVAMAVFFWRATRIPINRDADHDAWKRPDKGGGMGGGLP